MPGVRRVLGAILVAALLAAQQAALEHPLWHAAAAPGQNPLCEQHDALAAVAGAIDCAASVFAAEAPDSPVIAAVVPAPASPALVNPSSRGPPALL